VEKVVFKGATMLPFTTLITGGNARVHIGVRYALEKESEVCINEVYTLDQSCIKLERCLTVLATTEMHEVNSKMLWHLGLMKNQ